MRPLFPWRLRTRELALGERTRVMGVLNVTPDSFSDGGKFLARDRAVAHALLMFEEGADIVDIGGESTRPGSEARVPEAEELRRVLPVIEQVRRERPDALLSIDTYKAAVARAALEAGAEIVNDVSGLRYDPEMAALARKHRAALILMLAAPYELRADCRPAAPRR